MIQQVLAEPEWQNLLTGVDLRALSPLRWRHVNPYGTFTLNMRERLPLEQVALLPSPYFAEIWGFATLGPRSGNSIRSFIVYSAANCGARLCRFHDAKSTQTVAD